MVDHIKFTVDTAEDWKSALSLADKEDYKQCMKRIRDASTYSQLQSKLWLVSEIVNLGINIDRVLLIAGWYANFINPLLVDELGVKYILNLEIDPDVIKFSYKFNKRYKDQEKYQCHITDIMFKEIWRKEENYGAFDVLINTSCEHMFPMRRFRELNKNLSGNPIYVLQSTNEDKYEDHINCVSGPEELAEQAEFVDIMYSGTKTLDNGMERFMVIGK